MKKILIASLIGLLPTLLMAQQIAMNTKTKPPVLMTTIASANTTGSAKELRKAERANKQFARTTKAFERDFQNASGVQWSSSKSGHTASFTKDNVHTIAWYSKGGELQYTMLTYGADLLPDSEQRVIKSEYDGYKITSVNEVHQNNTVVYVVHLENARNIKLVTVCDGVTNIYKEYSKI